MKITVEYFNSKHEVTLSDDTNLDEIRDVMDDILRGCGYVIPYDFSNKEI